MLCFSSSISLAVLRGKILILEPADCESDREFECPAKRRRQDNTLLTVNVDDDYQSLSRSSSLLQFETLEKQCQETCNSSPSVYSQFSFDSLDVQRKANVSPDSLDRVQSDGEHESDYYKTLKIDVPRKKDIKAFFEDGHGFGGSDSSDSDGTLGRSRSFDHLRSWRSFDSLPTLSSSQPKAKDEVSVENLSEDSGYSDHLCNNSKYNPATSPGMKSTNSELSRFDVFENKPAKSKNNLAGFDAYDGDGFQSFSGNFGTSYQDLSVFDKYDVDVLENHRSPLIDRFLRRRVGGVQNEDSSVTKILNIEKSQECGLSSKYNCASASEPNLLAAGAVSTSQSVENLHVNSAKKSGNFLDNSVCACSVPKDLNLVVNIESGNSWSFDTRTESVAAKNFDIADLTLENLRIDVEDRSNCSSFHSSNPSEFLSSREASRIEEDMSSFRREGSYAEAMANRVDLSDDENSLVTKSILKRPRSTMEDFDRKILKAISEQSIQSLGNSRPNLLEPVYQTGYSDTISKQNRFFTSTPNVSVLSRQQSNNYEKEERRRSTYDVRRNGSITNGSASTSGMSDFDEKTLTSAKSLADSTSSKGVHFNPLVDELNWRDDATESTETMERESSYSLQSSPDREMSPPSPTPVEHKNLEGPERMSLSQPDLLDEKREFIESLKYFQSSLTKSQPDMSQKAKRRGSLLMKKDKDGCLIKAYVDGDGIRYQHTHLDLDNVYSNKPPTTSERSHVGLSNTESMQAKPVVGMASRVRDAAPRKEKGKFGGFFSRLASFRFSARKDSAKKKNGNVANKQNAPIDLSIAPHMRPATKDDYIYIPLKGPSTENNNRHKEEDEKPRVKVSGKPPVPRAPPRVVGASVKRDGGGATQQGGGADSHERRRRRTIDSGSRPRPMEPMGLIETDLDTEVTVVTDGADVKTRSLLNLGAAQPTGTARLQLSTAPREAHRPHKSMEFLLDKENIKVVEYYV
ncbi:hypothetical protein WA026_005672 [Henosepilachna vigintioctopunctata]|uniref:Uncharacterized protein n=1 Tax=Henosepilachna vigintioctopunctata TaxID=420089 RepID=A0AAW1TTJ6_9CUCU